MTDVCKTVNPAQATLGGLCDPDEIAIVWCDGCDETHAVDAEGYRVRWDHEGQDMVRVEVPHG